MASASACETGARIGSALAPEAGWVSGWGLELGVGRSDEV